MVVRWSNGTGGCSRDWFGDDILSCDGDLPGKMPESFERFTSAGIVTGPTGVVAGSSPSRPCSGFELPVLADGDTGIQLNREHGHVLCPFHGSVGRVLDIPCSHALGTPLIKVFCMTNQATHRVA